jgi:hypothetical protein
MQQSEPLDAIDHGCALLAEHLEVPVALLPAALLLLTALPHCAGYHLACTRFQRIIDTNTSEFFQAAWLQGRINIGLMQQHAIL